MALEIRPPANRRELIEAAKAIGPIHHGHDPEAGAHRFVKYYHDFPNATPEDTRLAYRDGTLVGGLRVARYDLRVGRAAVSMGGLSWVSTLEKYRMEGYGAELVGDAVDYIGSCGCDVSLLFGISDFYHRFGYAPAMSGQCVVVNTKDACRAKQYCSVRRFAPRDAEAAIRCFNRNNADRTGTCVRKRAYWPWYRQSFAKARVVEGPRKRMLGYFIAGPAKSVYSVRELVLTPRVEVYETVLAWLGQRAKANHAERIRFEMPTDHHFATYSRDYGALFESRYTRAGGGMMRIMDVSSLLRKIEPELRRRAVSSGQRFTFGRIEFRTDIGTASVCLAERTRGSVTVRIDQNMLIRAIMGRDSFQELRQTGRARVPARAVPELDVLFPKHIAHVWSLDGF